MTKRIITAITALFMLFTAAACDKIETAEEVFKTVTVTNADGRVVGTERVTAAPGEQTGDISIDGNSTGNVTDVLETARLASKDFIFTAADYTIKDRPSVHFRAVTADSNAVYAITLSDERFEDGDISMRQIQTLFKTDYDGNIIAERELSNVTNLDDYNCSFSDLRFCADGKLYAILAESVLNPPGSEYMYDTVYSLVSFDENLEMKTVLDISASVKGIAGNISIDVRSFAVDKDGVFCCSIGGAIGAAIDIETGRLLYSKEKSSSVISLEIQAMPDGRAGFVEGWQDADFTNLATISPFLSESGKLGEPKDYPGAMRLTPGDSSYDYYGFSDTALVGYTADFTTITVCDLSASGITIQMMSSMTAVSTECFVISGMDIATGYNKVTILKKVDPENVKSRKLIEVAAQYNNTTIAAFVADFNRTSTEYQVEYKTYFTQGESTIDSALSDLAKDILAGNLPDVLILDSTMPYESYAKKGLFADLYPIIDNDPELERADFVQSIISAMETDGKLYSIPPAFNIMSGIGKKEVFGDKTGFTMDELSGIAASRGASLLGRGISKSSFLDHALYGSFENFFDENGADFNTPEFISLIKFANTLPNEQDLNAQRIDQSTFRTGESLLKMYTMANFRTIVELEKADFGSEVSFIGMPNSQGTSGITAGLTAELAIISDSENKDGAWAFVKSFLAYEGGDNRMLEGALPLHGFPILRSKLDKYAKEATEDTYIIDRESGEKVRHINTYWNGTGAPMELPNNTTADNERVYALIDSIEYVGRGDFALRHIVEDDLENYFNGSKSAEDTAAMIQNRAETYLAESY